VGAVLGLGCFSVSETFLQVAARFGKVFSKEQFVCALIAIPGFGGVPSSSWWEMF
jgi:hypothetical protein